MMACRSVRWFWMKIGSRGIQVALAALVLCWMSGAAIALSIPVTASDGTPMGTIDVMVSADGTGVVGGFNAVPSLAAAAAANNEDHFNWHQVVVRDNDPPTDAAGNALVPPYDDPPPGGYPGQWGDSLPWYWDEEDPPSPTTEGYDSNYDLSNNVDATTLEFQDFPGGPAGTSLEFNTWLVSLNADGSLHSYHGGFSWTWDAGGGGGGGGRNVYPPLPTGQIVVITGFLAPIPEPGSLTLLSICFVLIVVQRRSVR